MHIARQTVAALIAAGFFSGLAPPGRAAALCLQQGDATAFQIIGLKSTLMVEALSCGMAKSYDNFMTRFQDKVLDSQHSMDQFFIRAGGLAGVSMEDGFTTQLANEEADAAAHQGLGFCANAAKQFATVAALAGVPDMEGYAAGQKLAAPPGDAALCPVPPPAPPPTAVATVIATNLPGSARPTHLRRHAAPRVELAQKPVAPPKPVPVYLAAQTI